MHVFIDESGSFTGFRMGSVSVVGALAIPDAKLDFIAKKYQKIRRRLPLEKGEVKGRLLNEAQIDDVVELLARNEVIFEITAIDLGLQTEEQVRAYKKQHGENMLERVNRFAPEVRDEVRRASEEIFKTSVPLYLQALTTFDVIHRLIGYMGVYYSQRRPQELGAIAWVVDGKDRQKVTRWEKWWANYAQGAMATMSKRRPSPRIAYGDYSFYEKSYGMTDDTGETGTDLKRLLANIRFESKFEPGLEFVDILANAVRRTLTGNLQEPGWRNIRQVMIHRTEDPYIQFVVFGADQDIIRDADYVATVRAGFRHGGKSMMTPQVSRLVAAEITRGG